MPDSKFKPKMNSIRYAATALAALALLSACKKPESGAAPVAASPTANQIPKVVALSSSDVLTVTRQTLERRVDWTGTLKARNTAIVRSKVAGELVTLSVREGETVKAGQVIARIDPTDANLRLAERQAAVASAQATVNNTARVRENNQRLLAQNFISQTAFDASDSNWQVAKAQLEAAQAQLAQAKKAVNDTVIVAPMSGVVADRSAQSGEKVALDARLLSIIDTQSLEIEAAVPSSDIAYVRIGQSARFQVEGQNAGEGLPASVSRITPATVGNSRTVLIYLAPQNVGAASTLKAGMFVQGQLNLERRDVAQSIQALAVRERQGDQGWLMTINAPANGPATLSKVPVKLGLQQGHGPSAWVELLVGPPAGTLVLTSTLSNLNPGQEVKTPGGSANAAAAPASTPVAAQEGR